MFLVGVLHEERADCHPFCVEPEDGFWLSPDSLKGIVETAASLVGSYPESQLFISDARSFERHGEELQLRAIVDATRQCLMENPCRPADMEYFFSSPVKIDGYHVMMVLGIAQKEIKSVPRLVSDHYQLHACRSYAIPTCLIEAVADQLLAEAADIMARVNKEDYFARRSTDDMLRDAAHQMIKGLALRCDEFHNTIGQEQASFDHFCRISGAFYESSKADGSIMLARQDHPSLVKKMELAKPISLSNIRGTRKLLELTRSGKYHLHTNSNDLWGLVEVDRAAEVTDNEDIFEIRFLESHCWECAYHGQVLLRVENRIPKLPGQTLNAKQVSTDLRRWFPSMAPDVVATYVTLVEACAKQEHGALLVISNKAMHECERLSRQSTPIKPIRADDALIYSLASIDGAVLLDLEGQCWAIGVILDGLACEEGNPSRGARYNSAIRYVSTRPKECLAFIVSEDGGIDMIPKLKPQVSRRRIDAELLAIQELAKQTQLPRRIFDHISWLDKHRFYLRADDCELLNELVPDVEQRWDADSETMVRMNRDTWSNEPEFDPVMHYSE